MTDIEDAPANHAKSPGGQRRRRVLWAVLYVSLGLFLIGTVYVTANILELVATIREDQKTNASTNRAVLDCTDPEGKCAKEGARKTAEAVNNIGRLSVYASACAADADPDLTVRERAVIIQRCVLELVQQPPALP